MKPTHILVPIEKFNSFPEDDTCDMVDFVRGCSQVDLSEEGIDIERIEFQLEHDGYTSQEAEIAIRGYKQARLDLLKFFVLTILLIIAGTVTYAQDTTSYIHPENEVFTIKETPKYIKLMTDYEDTYKETDQFFGDSIKYVTVNYLKDHGGRFKRFTVYLPLSMKEEVEAYLKNKRYVKRMPDK